MGSRPPLVHHSPACPTARGAPQLTATPRLTLCSPQSSEDGGATGGGIGGACAEAGGGGGGEEEEEEGAGAVEASLGGAAAEAELSRGELTDAVALLIAWLAWSRTSESEVPSACMPR
jgi:hypothetical protein